MRYTAILFDLDGTLLNTIDDLANSLNFILKQHGLPVHPVEKYKTFVGNGMEKLVRRVLPTDHHDEKTVATILAEFKTKYNECWHNDTKPYPGINMLLDNLESLRIRMSVLSNKADQFTSIMIDYFFGLDRFDFVVGARDGVPNKPDPTAALEIVKGSNIESSSYLYLGDSGVDMQTANAAGLYALGATWGFRSTEELEANGAKKLIYDPMEIIELIKG